MSAKLENALGKTYINDQAIATIAGMCALDCYGIVGMTAKGAKDGFAQLLGRDNVSRGISVTTKDDDITIELFVILEYGISIQTVAENIIDNVKYYVEKYTGLKVSSVNVTVESIRA